MLLTTAALTSYDPKLKNQIIHGDCMDILDQIPENSVDLVVTDPPYHIPVNHFVKGKGTVCNTRYVEDQSILSTYFKMLFKKLKRVSSSKCVWYIFCDGQSYPVFYNVLLPLVHSARPLIWDKTNAMLGYTWRHQYEMIIYAVTDQIVKIPTKDPDILRHKTVWVSKRKHPAQKPVDLLQALIRKHKDVNTVLDPFAGSGSTLVAALTSGVHYTGIELNEEYVEIAISRCASSKLGVDGFARVEQYRGLKY